MHDVPYFDAFAPVYDFVMPATERAPLAAGLGNAQRDVERVLDLGGGTGRAARALEGGATVLDASRGMLERAADAGLPVVQGDVGGLPIQSASADAAVIVDALHHFPDVPAALDEAARVLRPGGVLVVREFDPSTVRGRLLEAAEHAIRFESTFYTPDALRGLLADAGFAPQVVERGFAYTVAGVREQRSE
ncbi:class I SAM-dependent methyltransferase [Salarchaeum sp. JOR-1]|uniref:class I SAM-dependent methyltransferase n=1 Tax=Salarchaeum sp. JOR-1 TaxID=2599399 RepID=UPI001198714E|nr:methyltransferase domain-containing protein [Salarchaeum sp. JOR-1]QDX41093.1 methyltransferase domain-containing protein [Salarchaeum sp. JOR-1]